jgi:hypothetical protein
MRNSIALPTRTLRIYRYFRPCDNQYVEKILGKLFLKVLHCQNGYIVVFLRYFWLCRFASKRQEKRENTKPTCVIQDKVNYNDECKRQNARNHQITSGNEENAEYHKLLN